MHCKIAMWVYAGISLSPQYRFFEAQQKLQQ